MILKEGEVLLKFKIDFKNQRHRIRFVMAPHVTPDEFIKDLTQLFTLTKDKGTVFLSQKRMTFDDNKDTKMGSNGNDDEQYEVVLRASAQVNETQYKSSTRIPSTQVHNFINEYNNLLRSNMSHKLRKRDRKREKRKADIANIRKRQLETPVEITGSKRGAGRRKRVRKILAERKRQDALNKLQQGQLSSSNVIT